MKQLSRAAPLSVPVQQEYPKLCVTNCVLPTDALLLLLLEIQQMAELHLLNALAYINTYTYMCTGRL